MHTVPGGQNPDWHSDNVSNYAAFWDFKDHQDRTIWLWEEIAKHYKDNTWVAGYNPITSLAILNTTAYLLSTTASNLQSARLIQIIYYGWTGTHLQWNGKGLITYSRIVYMLCTITL